jgi:hypothetical protein
MGGDAVQFTNTVSNSVVSDWLASDSFSFSFACAGQLRYIVFGDRLSSNGSVQLSTGNSSNVVTYVLELNDGPVPAADVVQVMSSETSGLSTFITIPVDIIVSASAINAAVPDIYSNVANVEIFLF